MGLLDRIFRRGGKASAEAGRRISTPPALSAEQAKTNRDLMEAEMAESRRKREEGDSDA